MASAAANSFSAAFDKMSNRQPGAKGELEEASSGSVRVDTFSKLVQGTSWEEVRKMMDDMSREFERLKEHDKSDAKEYFTDMVKLWAFKRDPHSKGEGNRISSHYYLLCLAMDYPEMVRAMITSGMIETYGTWKDMRKIIIAIHSLDMTSSQKMRYFDYPIVSAIRKHLMEARSESLKNLDGWTRQNMGKSLESISADEIRETIRALLNKETEGIPPCVPLLAKYIVAEKGSDNKKGYWFVKDGSNHRKVSLVNYLVRYSLTKYGKNGTSTPYPANQSIPYSVLKAYRTANSKHKAAMDLFESYFPRKEAHMIHLERVASKAKFGTRKALLNEKVKGPAPTSAEEHTGNRFPEDKDRVACRANTRTYYRDCGAKNMQTKSVLPHHITYNLSQSKSFAEGEMFMGMWNAKVEQYQERIQKLELPEGVSMNQDMAGVRKGNVISVFDTSGSMMCVGKEGERPYDIALGLTAFLSEIAAKPYKNKAITFSRVPRLVNLANNDGTTKPLKTRYELLTRGSGLNTDFYATNVLLAELCQKNKVSEDDLPVLLILSDEGWDVQTGMKPADYRTHHEKIIQIWLDHGFTRVPTFVYWNLTESGETHQYSSYQRGFQTKADFPGVMFLQGRSPNLFDLIIYGEMTPVEETTVVIEGKEVTIKTNTITPEQNFRNAMSLPEFYEPLVEVVDRMFK